MVDDLRIVPRLQGTELNRGLSSLNSGDKSQLCGNHGILYHDEGEQSSQELPHLWARKYGPHDILETNTYIENVPTW